MSERVRSFLAQNDIETPCLVVDLEVVRETFEAFARALPDTHIYYAVKANPAPAILDLLADLGSRFDCASPAEVDLVLGAGAEAGRISYGSTIKKERDIASAFAKGVRLFAFDCAPELDKIARVAPGATVFCRLATEAGEASWPLSRKFGCSEAEAIRLLEQAAALGLDPAGISFHVGSQQPDPEAWDAALASSARIFETLDERGIALRMVNLGGGFPARTLGELPAPGAYGAAIRSAIARHFGNRPPATLIEPGRGLVADAGTIQAEVVLISERQVAGDVVPAGTGSAALGEAGGQVGAESRHGAPLRRWVYLDIGKFGGLAETMDEAIRYPIRTPRDGDVRIPAVLAGPTCDSVDVLYERNPYPLPVSLAIGDKVLIEAAGAYTTTYSSIGFNGFAPLRSVCI